MHRAIDAAVAVMHVVYGLSPGLVHSATKARYAARDSVSRC